jgi:Skp family chaperone for outer membrane proteins
MAMTFLAMWFQDSDMASSLHSMSTFMGILAISVAALTALIMVGGAVLGARLLKAVNKVTTIATELQTKANPIMHEVAAISKHTREVLEDAKPKIATITDNLARTSATLSEAAVTAKATVEKVQQTVVDANSRTQRQVARVDNMVSAALNTTADVVESINHGIKVPAQKIAQAASQARVVAEGLLDRIKSMAAATPFGGHKPASRQASYGSTGSSAASYRSPGSGSTSGASTSASPSNPTGTSYAAAPKTP